MMGVAVLIGELVALGGSLYFPLAFLGFSTAFMLTGASMVVNDYYDRNVDAINAPERPIPSGIVSTQEALAYAFVLFIMGLIAAALTDFLCLVIGVFATIVSIAYNTKGKRMGLIGNFMVSYCVANPFIYGGCVVGNVLKPLTLMFALPAFLSNVGREITKGITDVEGDRLRDVRTIAILYGSGRAAILAAVFYLLAVVLSPLPLLYGLVSSYYLPIVALSDVGFIVLSILLIINHTPENARRMKQMVLLSMMLALLAFVGGLYGR